MTLITDELFDKKNFGEIPFEGKEYEQCVFSNCDMAHCNLSEIKFINCTFIGCNLSMVILAETAFRDIVFKNCKMLGLQFHDCNTFALSFLFENCVLNDSSFYKMNIPKTVFRQCQLRDIDFSESVLTESVFDDCDLNGTTFERCTLEKADFRTAYNYIFDPEHNTIKKAKFSLHGTTGLLTKYNIIIHE